MQPKFTADEKVLTLIWELFAKCEFQVLCYHGPLLYEAKILKSKKESGNYSYFVHYQVKTGWRRLICFRHIISCKNWCVTWRELLDDILFKRDGTRTGTSGWGRHALWNRFQKLKRHRKFLYQWLQVPESYEKQKKLLQNHAAANKAQKKAVKEAKKKKGGSDSGANSRWYRIQSWRHHQDT